MPTRADIDPVQATAVMDKAQEQARRADSNLMDAEQREEELVEQMNALAEAGHTDEDLAGLLEQHQQAERDLDLAKQEYEEAMHEVGSVQDFWFEEIVDEDGNEIDEYEDF